jgi:RecA-family ATPase
MTATFTPDDLSFDYLDAEPGEQPTEGQAPGPDEPSLLDRLRAELVDAAGLDTIPDPDPLIGNDILFRDSLVWMVGKPGCMKSFTALDMAGCIGTGEPWQGWHVQQGPVLILVAEGVRGTKKRVRAWEKAMGRTMDNVHFLPVAVQSKHAAQWRAFIELAAEVRPALVVIDTQARVTVGVEENSNTEMGEFVEQAERLRRATGACVMIVHHIGRNGDTGRGATTLDGAMSTIVKVTKDDDLVKLECTKNKDGAEWADITLRVVPMGDSVVLATADGAWGRPAENDVAARKWVHEWWRVHEREPVSVSVLVKSGVVSETTFHRSKLDLVKQGIAAKEGEGNATRYRLITDPTAR